MAKPYSTSHIGSVASEFTDLRLSGAVREALVGVVMAELDRLVPQLEAATIEAEPERKTLADPDRTRLGYSRTRELMLDRIDSLDSVGSAAVQRAIEELESTLSSVVRQAGELAENQRLGTIKPRHLDAVLAARNHGVEIPGDESTSQMENETEPEKDELSDAIGSGQVLTPNVLRKMARSFAGMPVTDAALEELLLLYYDVAEDTEHRLRTSFTSDNPEPFIEKIGQMKDLMRLGWMRRMLKRSGEYARERGYKRVDIEQVVNLDPFA